LQDPTASRAPIHERAYSDRDNRAAVQPAGAEFIRNPYPYYERLRTTDPMHLAPFGAFVASRHAEAGLVLRDKRFARISSTAPCGDTGRRSWNSRSSAA
jgi:cytochrome P450